MADDAKEETPVENTEEPAADVEAQPEAEAPTDTAPPAEAPEDAPSDEGGPADADAPADEGAPADATAPADVEAPADAANEGGTPAEDGEKPVEEEPEEDKQLRLTTMVVLVICGAMIGLYGASMGIWGGTVLFVAGVVAIIVGALVAKFQYFDLESLETLRQVHNRLRASVNDFSAENDKLTANNDRLEEEIAPLKQSEEKLSQLAEQNGSDVKKLTGLVSENQKTLDEMHELQKQDVVQSLMGVLMDVDKNEDGDLSDREVKRLLRAMRNLPTVDVNEELFERKLEKHRSVATFLDIVHQVNDDSIPPEERIFKISEDPIAEEEE